MFKVGDEVVAIKTPDFNARLVGEIGIVEEVDLDDDLPVCVAFFMGEGLTWWCEEESLELYQPDLENV